MHTYIKFDDKFTGQESYRTQLSVAATVIMHAITNKIHDSQKQTPFIEAIQIIINTLN